MLFLKIDHYYSAKLFDKNFITIFLQKYTNLLYC